MLVVNNNRSSKDIKYKIIDTNSGYNLELMIPWKEIAGINPHEGISIPFNIEASDCDKTDTTKGIYYGRDISISWSPKSCRRTWQQTINIGSLHLVGLKEN